MFSLLSQYSKQNKNILPPSQTNISHQNTSNNNNKINFPVFNEENKIKSIGFSSNKPPNKLQEIYRSQLASNSKKTEEIVEENISKSKQMTQEPEKTNIKTSYLQFDDEDDEFDEGSSDSSDTTATKIQEEDYKHTMSNINSKTFEIENSRADNLPQNINEEHFEQNNNKIKKSFQMNITNSNEAANFIDSRQKNLNEKRLENLRKAREVQQEIKKRKLEQVSSNQATPTSLNFTQPSVKPSKKDFLTYQREKNQKNEMFQQFNKDENVDSDAHKEKIASEAKKNYKRKSKMEKFAMWNKDCYFVSIDPPIPLPEESRTRYKIGFKYYCSIENKMKRKTIFFGKKDTQYFIDHKDENKNRLWLSKQRGYYTPFHKNFWINYLLCSETNIVKAYNKTIETLLVR